MKLYAFGVTAFAAASVVSAQQLSTQETDALVYKLNEVAPDLGNATQSGMISLYQDIAQIAQKASDYSANSGESLEILNLIKTFIGDLEGLAMKLLDMCAGPTHVNDTLVVKTEACQKKVEDIVKPLTLLLPKDKRAAAQNLVAEVFDLIEDIEMLVPDIEAIVAQISAGISAGKWTVADIKAIIADAEIIIQQVFGGKVPTKGRMMIELTDQELVQDAITYLKEAIEILCGPTVNDLFIRIQNVLAFAESKEDTLANLASVAILTLRGMSILHPQKYADSINAINDIVSKVDFAVANTTVAVDHFWLAKNDTCMIIPNITSLVDAVQYIIADVSVLMQPDPNSPTVSPSSASHLSAALVSIVAFYLFAN